MMSIFLVVMFLLLPGYACSILFPFVKGVAPRAGFAVVTSVALGVLVSVAAAFFKLPIGVAFAAALCAITFVIAVVKRSELGTLTAEWRNIERAERFFLIFVAVTSIGAAVLTAVPHLGKPFPLHVDEWWMVGTAQNFIDGRGIGAHPYILNSEFLDYKPGLTAYVAALSSITGTDPVNAWGYLPAVNIFLISFVSSCFLFARFRKTSASVLPIFLAALHSNAYALGWWFFVPFTFAFLFIPPLLIGVSTWAVSRRGVVFGALLFAALALTYLPFAIFTLIALIPALVAFLRRWRVAVLSGVSLVGVIAAVTGFFASPYKVYWTVSGMPVLPFREFLEPFFVPVTATFHIIEAAGFWNVAGIALVALGIFGAWVFRREKIVRGVFSAAVFGIALVLITVFARVSFLTFEARIFYFTGVALAILSALVVIQRFPSLRIHNTNRWIIALVLTGAFCFLTFNGYFSPPTGNQLYYLARSSDVKALTWLRGREDVRGLGVLADPPIGTIVTPLTRLSAPISTLTAQNVQAVVNPKETLVVTGRPCGEEQALMVRLNTGILYTHTPQSCTFLEKIYDSGGVFIYRSHEQSAR